MPPGGSHRCPGLSCVRFVQSRYLACADHWRPVPQKLRQAVHRAYDGGEGLGTPELQAAQAAAIKWMRTASNA